MQKVKLAFNPLNKKILVCKGDFHAKEMPVKTYDKWVRAIYFPEHRTIYFRFHSPTGEYHYISYEDEELSFKVCENALSEFIRKNVIPKKSKTLFWQGNEVINEKDFSY
jgi:hypothetical protein